MLVSTPAYLGDYPAGETIHFMWNSTNAAGASITRATNGTISVYKDNNTTQTTTGVTDTEDFDGLTGVHQVVIATGDAFYTVGTDFTVVLSGATIDGQTVNAVLAHFSIENRADISALIDVQSALDTNLDVPVSSVDSSVLVGVVYSKALEIQNLISGSLTVTSDVVGNTGNDTTHVHLGSPPFADDDLNNLLLVITDVSAGAAHTRWIEDFVSSSGLVTVEALPFTPEGGVDTYYVTTFRRDTYDAMLADSVPADGTRPTLAQAIYIIHQFLTEKSVSGTTLTVKKADGSTSLMTFTLDSGSAPTSITRAT